MPLGDRVRRDAVDLERHDMAVEDAQDALDRTHPAQRAGAPAPQLLLEIFSEEIPARMQQGAARGDFFGPAGPAAGLAGRACPAGAKPRLPCPRTGASAHQRHSRGNWLPIAGARYFQGVGGIEVDVVSGELTYGLERLAMYVQGVDNVYADTMSSNRRFRPSTS